MHYLIASLHGNTSAKQNSLSFGTLLRGIVRSCYAHHHLEQLIADAEETYRAARLNDVSSTSGEQ